MLSKVKSSVAGGRQDQKDGEQSRRERHLGTKPHREPSFPSFGHHGPATAQRITARGLGERVPAVRADRELARLIGVINGMLERLQRSFQQAARFGADAAHELKTPLTILQGQLEQSLQEAPDGSPAQRAMSDLLGEVQRLRSIVRKLLLLAQADAGRLGDGGMEVIDWSERVAELVTDLGELAPGLAVSADIAPGVTTQGMRTSWCSSSRTWPATPSSFISPGRRGSHVPCELEGERTTCGAFLIVALCPAQ